MIELEAGSSHLYPGARLRILRWQDGTTPAPAPALILFADGSQAAAMLGGGPAGATLEVAAYRTRAGTRIGPKTWLVESDEPAPRMTLVVRRARPHT